MLEFSSGNLKFSGATTYTLEGGATDPVWTPGNSVMNLSTGTLQQGGTAVALQSRTITGGNGVAAMGDLSADRTVAVGAGTGITVNADDVQLSYSSTLAANPAFNAEECAFSTDGGGGGGFLCEGATGGNTNEQLYLFPAVDGADTTNFIAVHSAQVTSLAGSGLEVSSGTLQLPAANRTLSKDINVLDPATSLSNKAQLYWPAAVTLTRVACSTDAGTVTIQLDERVENTPNTAGTNSLTSSLVCDNDSQTTTSFSDSGIAVDVPHNLQITATSGSPTVVRIHVKAAVN